MLTDVEKTDATIYQKLVDRAANKMPDTISSSTDSKEHSENIRKEIWIHNPEFRQQILLLSSGANLDFLRHEDKIEVVENLNQVKIWLQEELFYVDANGLKISKQEAKNHSGPLEEKQQILLLESENATYYWKTKCILANKANITRFQVAGHTLNIEQLSEDTSTMSGSAKQVTLGFKDKQIFFNAKQLHAKFVR